MLKRFKGFIVCRNAIAVLLAFFVLAAGCRPAKEVKVDASANGSQVELKKGQTLVITLESNPTTGYSWEVVELEEDILRQMGEPEFQPESEALGAPGVEILRFEATKPGQTALKLVYHRPWEEGVEPLDTFSLQVVVR